jgi:hypothetical protein
MARTLERSGIRDFLLDPFRPTAEGAEPAYRLGGDYRLWAVPAGIGVLFLALTLVGWLVDAKQFYVAYLVGWSFCLSISLGAMFFVVIQHLTRARWSVVVRRIAESLGAAIPLLIVLSIPIFIGMGELFKWTNPDIFDPAHPDYDALVAGKYAYLNTPFFFVRFVIYFGFWYIISQKLYKLSLLQDVSPDPLIPAKQRKVSAWGLPVLAVTATFAAFDLWMTLDPHWFSTIFGVYFFAGAMWATFALLTLLSLLFQKGDVGLRNVVTVEHYHDLGKFMFGFTVFWAYIAFSQYMLIWYGNIPEETLWYRHRLEYGWEYHSLALLVFHFIIPFIILLPRVAKRFTPLLAVMAVWFLIMHWFDIHWLVVPNFRYDAAFHWLDFTAWLGLFGVFMGAFLYRFKRHALVPRNEPYLSESLKFHNI